MKNHRAIVLYLVSVSVMATGALGWFAATNLNLFSTSKNNEPPALASDGMKASLLYPKLKVRGPQPGQNLRSKPLYRDEMANP